MEKVNAGSEYCKYSSTGPGSRCLHKQTFRGDFYDFHKLHFGKFWYTGSSFPSMSQCSKKATPLMVTDGDLLKFFVTPDICYMAHQYLGIVSRTLRENSCFFTT